MAIYHFSAKMISRANGSSALAAAAYRSAARLYDQRLDRHHDFSNKAGVVHSEVMLPDSAPEAWVDREKLWNAVEATELRKDAQLAREVEFAIPRELNQAQGIRLAREFVAREFVARGMVADLNVHWDVSEDGNPKPHAHVMLTSRGIDGDGFGPKQRDWNATSLLEHWRKAWADHVNTRLAELDIDARIDHRSLEAQGIDLEPQNKIGPAASRMVDRGEQPERLVEHQAIARANGARILAAPHIALDAITHQQATFTTRDLAMFVHRHSEGKEQFDRVFAAVRAAPDLIELGRDGRGDIRFTSRDMLETEQRLERASAVLAERRSHGLPAAAIDQAIAAAGSDGLQLEPEQQAALRHIAKPDGLSIIVGYAGTGKSALLGVARDGWEQTGYRVTGLALSGIAAENLESGSGIASRTIASLEHQWGQGRELLSSRDILVVDEAGMIGTRQMERIIREAEKRGAKLVLVGDPEQLQAIEAGAAFRSVAERHGAQEITEIRRQREDWQRDATRHLATGRTGEAIRAYEEAGHVHVAETRESARAALIERWDADRLSHGVPTTMILAHTRAECDELNEMARDAMGRSGALSAEYAIDTTRGQRLFAAGDRIMFLRNERSLDVRNGTLATIEQVDPRRMAVRLDNGRAVQFDIKNYADITHGYAATIHKAQGVTVDRVHVLATPGLDRHAAYVALSRHRDGVELHYGRDDFETSDRLVRTLSRDRSKDIASDHVKDFAERRQIIRRGDAIGRADTVERQPPRRGVFDGLRRALASGGPNPKPKTPARSPFAGLRLAADQPVLHERHKTPLDAAVGRYARACQDRQRMIERDLPELEYQKSARLVAAQMLDRMRPGAALDLDAAFAAHPALIEEAAAGRTAATIRAMQLEAEVRTDPEMRADRFVQAWQRLRARYDRLEGCQGEAARDAIEDRMTAMAKRIGKDPALGSALFKRANELGLGHQWSPEWSRSSPDGGMAHELTDRTKARAIGMALTASLGRGRGLGL